VQSLLLMPVDRSPAPAAQFSLPRLRTQSQAGTDHYGVVLCGRLLFALGSAHVIEAVAASRMSAPTVASGAAGMLEYSRDGQSTVLPVYDACKLTGQGAISDPAQAVAIIVRRQGQAIALLVDRLVDVIESDALAEPPGGINPRAPWICGYIHDGLAGTEPVFAMDPNGLDLAPGQEPVSALS
jgi:hypothetical protein